MNEEDVAQVLLDIERALKELNTILNDTTGVRSLEEKVSATQLILSVYSALQPRYRL